MPSSISDLILESSHSWKIFWELIDLASYLQPQTQFRIPSLGDFGMKIQEKQGEKISFWPHFTAKKNQTKALRAQPACFGA